MQPIAVFSRQFIASHLHWSASPSPPMSPLRKSREEHRRPYQRWSKRTCRHRVGQSCPSLSQTPPSSTSRLSFFLCLSVSLTLDPPPPVRTCVHTHIGKQARRHAQIHSRAHAHIHSSACTRTHSMLGRCDIIFTCIGKCLLSFCDVRWYEVLTFSHYTSATCHVPAEEEGGGSRMEDTLLRKNRNIGADFFEQIWP